MIIETLYNQLIAEGGFCWDHRRWGEMKVTIHFNRGRRPSPGLVSNLRQCAAELKEFVFKRNDEKAAWLLGLGATGAGVGAPVVGSSTPKTDFTADGEVARGN